MGGNLIPQHGGFRNTKTWQLADLIDDVTVLFCDRFVDRRSRTHDQMVQAARSGCQNLQEGSVDSATSKKLEIKLTGTAKGSLMELERDYQKFLKHNGLAEWPPVRPALVRFKSLRCETLEGFRAWVAQEVQQVERLRARQHGPTRTDTDQHETLSGCANQHGPMSSRAGRGTPANNERRSGAGPLGAGPCRSVGVRVSPPGFVAECAANGALSLLNLCIHLVKKLMQSQADAFEKEGGFTERLYRIRRQRRDSG